MYFLTERDIEKIIVILPQNLREPIRNSLVYFTKSYGISRRYHLDELNFTVHLSEPIQKEYLVSMLQSVKPRTFRKEIYDQLLIGDDTIIDDLDISDENKTDLGNFMFNLVSYLKNEI